MDFSNVIIVFTSNVGSDILLQVRPRIPVPFFPYFWLTAAQ